MRTVSSVFDIVSSDSRNMSGSSPYKQKTETLLREHICECRLESGRHRESASGPNRRELSWREEKLLGGAKAPKHSLRKKPRIRRSGTERKKR